MSDPKATGGPPPSVEAQDPLPEGSWFWRRMFTFTLAALLIGLAYLHIGDVGRVALSGSETAIKGLVSLSRIELALIGLLILFYMLAPSAEQLTKLIQTGAALRSGVGFKSTTTAVAPDGSSATVHSEVAPVDAPAKSEEPSMPSPPETGSPGLAPDGYPWAKEQER